MIQREKKLISEKNLVVEGDLYRGLLCLGKFKVNLTVRKSILQVNSAGQPEKSQEKDCLILTMMGSLYTDGKQLSLNIDHKNKDQLTLHLNEDYFFPVTLLPTREQWEYQVLGCVVTKATASASPYL